MTVRLSALVTKFVNDVSASYWFVPSCMVLCAIILSLIAEQVDVWASASTFVANLFPSDTGPTAARAILTTIAGSIIGVAGVTFSVTMVAVSFASANFGPRLISNFMRDRGNQLTLGTFIGTFVYALLILRTVRDADKALEAFVPHFSVLVAVGLALASIGMLIYYIHHVPETINVGNIAAHLGRDMHHGISTLFPDREDLKTETTKYGWVETVDESAATPVHSTLSGYIQTLDTARLVELADEENLKIIVRHVPGDFVTPRDSVLKVWADPQPDDGTIDALLSTFALGDQRTKYQNVAFVAEQLVEIIARAMSPGINDPFTAKTCLNWLRSGLEAFAQKEMQFLQPSGNERIFVQHLSFVKLLVVICDGSRQHVAQNGVVTRHMLSVMENVAAALPSGTRLDAVCTEYERLYLSSQAVLTDPSEIQAIKAQKTEFDELLRSRSLGADRGEVLE